MKLFLMDLVFTICETIQSKNQRLQQLSIKSTFQSTHSISNEKLYNYFQQKLYTQPDQIDLNVLQLFHIYKLNLFRYYSSGIYSKQFNPFQNPLSLSFCNAYVQENFGYLDDCVDFGDELCRVFNCMEYLNFLITIWNTLNDGQLLELNGYGLMNARFVICVWMKEIICLGLCNIEQEFGKYLKTSYFYSFRGNRIK